jgi:hypothetical protein
VNVEINSTNVGNLQVASNVGGAASAGKALARVSAAMTVAVDTSKIMRLM